MPISASGRPVSLGSMNRLDPRYSSIHRANRSGGGIGTSPGICTVAPYTNASLDYRASWISGDMVAKTRFVDPSKQARQHAERLNNEARGLEFKQSFERKEWRPPPQRAQYLESNGLQRSLATNVADHPAAIQVNSLRQERTEGVMCPGYVHGVNSYNSGTLVGNWSEERCDKGYRQPVHKPSSLFHPSRWTSTYMEQTAHASDKVLPTPGSIPQAVYTPGQSALAVGSIEAPAGSNNGMVRLGGDAGANYHTGDALSAPPPAGSLINYQSDKQTGVEMVGGKVKELLPYETTTSSAFSDPNARPVAQSTSRCDLHKQPFQIRDPSRDPKSKLLCRIKSNEYGYVTDDPEYLNNHTLGFPYKGKQKVYTLEEYRQRWTKSAPEVKQAGELPASEHRNSFQKYTRG